MYIFYLQSGPNSNGPKFLIYFLLNEPNSIYFNCKNDLNSTIYVDFNLMGLFLHILILK